MRSNINYYSHSQVIMTVILTDLNQTEALGYLLKHISKFYPRHLYLRKLKKTKNIFSVTNYFSNLYCTCILYQNSDEKPGCFQNNLHDPWPVLLWQINNGNEMEVEFLKSQIELGCRVRI